MQLINSVQLEEPMSKVQEGPSPRGDSSSSRAYKDGSRDVLVAKIPPQRQDVIEGDLYYAKRRHNDPLHEKSRRILKKCDDFKCLGHPGVRRTMARAQDTKFQQFRKDEARYSDIWNCGDARCCKGYRRLIVTRASPG